VYLKNFIIYFSVLKWCEFFARYLTRSISKL